MPYCREPNNWVRTLTSVLEEFDITTPQRQAMFIAQAGHESAFFNRLRENLSYSANQLMKVWPHKFPTMAAAFKYERMPEELGNYVYSNTLGNGDFDSGDGFRFRGGGLFQLTGRWNYAQVGTALNLDLEARPKQIELPAIAARTAGFFWKHHNLNQAADDNDINGATKIINGHMEGAEERAILWMKLLPLCGGVTNVSLAVGA